MWPNLPRWHKHQFVAYTFELRFSQEFFAKRMDRRVISAFTRVFDALCPPMTKWVPRVTLWYRARDRVGNRHVRLPYIVFAAATS
jgi:hypothetical protein